MNTHEEIYRKLRKEFSDEEIAEGYLLTETSNLSKFEDTEAEFKALRFKLLTKRTEQQRLLSELMRMKLLIEDYVEEDVFQEEFSFSSQLSQYIHILGRSQKDFAEEIDVHPTKLSRILNNREAPNPALAYRLEKHCGNIIPAVCWWKLYAKRMEENIRTGKSRREAEQNRVKNYLTFSH